MEEFSITWVIWVQRVAWNRVADNPSMDNSKGQDEGNIWDSEKYRDYAYDINFGDSC